MPTTDGSVSKLATKAEENVLGTKFCFGCQKPRDIETGRHIMRGKTKAWRCINCINKKNPVGFKT
jgi:hypothetical protein